MRHSFCALSLLVPLALCGAASAQETFRFIALGYAPYGQPDKVYGKFRTLIDTINARAPALVVHVGDIKAGGTPCSPSAP